MKYTEQDFKDEYEQAVKRKGELYAEGYVEGLKDGQKQVLNIINVVGQSEQLKDFIDFCSDNYSLEIPDRIIEAYKQSL